VTGAGNGKRLAVAGLLVALAPLGAHVSALALSTLVAALLTALALWELRPVAHRLRHLQQQPEGASS
jgi:hypothetical protein